MIAEIAQRPTIVPSRASEQIPKATSIRNELLWPDSDSDTDLDFDSEDPDRDLSEEDDSEQCVKEEDDD